MMIDWLLLVRWMKRIFSIILLVVGFDITILSFRDGSGLGGILVGLAIALGCFKWARSLWHQSKKPDEYS
jgi:hypothetical protein